MSSTRSGGPAERPARWRSLYFMAPSKWGWLTRQRSILWTTHRMPRMPEGEGGEARGRLSCSRVISLCGGRRTRWSCHIRVPSRTGRRLREGIESAHPCSAADRQGSPAASAGRQHMRHQSSEELSSCGRGGRVGRGSSEQLLAAGSNRGRLMPSRSDAGRAARACAKCDKRQKTTGA